MYMEICQIGLHKQIKLVQKVLTRETCRSFIQFNKNDFQGKFVHV